MVTAIESQVSALFSVQFWQDSSAFWITQLSEPFMLHLFFILHPSKRFFERHAGEPQDIANRADLDLPFAIHVFSDGYIGYINALTQAGNAA